MVCGRIVVAELVYVGVAVVVVDAIVAVGVGVRVAFVVAVRGGP